MQNHHDSQQGTLTSFPRHHYKCVRPLTQQHRQHCLSGTLQLGVAGLSLHSQLSAPHGRVPPLHCPANLLFLRMVSQDDGVSECIPGRVTEAHHLCWNTQQRWLQIDTVLLLGGHHSRPTHQYWIWLDTALLCGGRHSCPTPCGWRRGGCCRRCLL